MEEEREQQRSREALAKPGGGFLRNAWGRATSKVDEASLSLDALKARYENQAEQLAEEEAAAKVKTIKIAEMRERIEVLSEEINARDETIDALQDRLHKASACSRACARLPPHAHGRKK